MPSWLTQRNAYSLLVAGAVQCDLSDFCRLLRDRCLTSSGDSLARQQLGLVCMGVSFAYTYHCLDFPCYKSIKENKSELHVYFRLLVTDSFAFYSCEHCWILSNQIRLSVILFRRYNQTYRLALNIIVSTQCTGTL